MNATMEARITMTVSAPTAVPGRLPAGYNDSGRQEVLQWQVVRQRLEQAKHFWFSTADDSGTPHARPIWGAWVDNTLYAGFSSADHDHGRSRRRHWYGVVVDTLISPDRSRIGRENSVESLCSKVLPIRSADRARAAVSAR